MMLIVLDPPLQASSSHSVNSINLTTVSSSSLALWCSLVKVRVLRCYPTNSYNSSRMKVESRRGVQSCSKTSSLSFWPSHIPQVGLCLPLPSLTLPTMASWFILTMVVLQSPSLRLLNGGGLPRCHFSTNTSPISTLTWRSDFDGPEVVIPLRYPPPPSRLSLGLFLAPLLPFFPSYEISHPSYAITVNRD